MKTRRYTNRPTKFQFTANCLNNSIEASSATKISQSSSASSGSSSKNTSTTSEPSRVGISMDLSGAFIYAKTLVTRVEAPQMDRSNSGRTFNHSNTSNTSISSINSNPSNPSINTDPQIMEKLKAAAMAQAASQSLGNYKPCEGDSQYGNFLIPTLPQ